MKKLEKDDRILCELQGEIFEESAAEYKTSSAVFVRRYMNSQYASIMDKSGFIDRPTSVKEAFISLDEQYGKSEYGSKIYSTDELFWIGYVYRCWACIYGLPSSAIYKICNVRQMHDLYYAYHTMTPENAIERIMEAKNKPLNDEDQIEYGVKLLREIRNSKV